MKIIFLGSGNLATRLSLEMHRKGMQIGQVYSSWLLCWAVPGQLIPKLSIRMLTCMSFL